MKIKIVKAKFPSYWYANRIGAVFEVKPSREESYHFEVVNPAGVDPRLLEIDGSVVYNISKDDCEIVAEITKLELISFDDVALRPVHVRSNIFGRKCEFDGLFHRWVNYANEKSSAAYGIVEKDSGSVVLIDPTGITFLDRVQAK